MAKISEIETLKTHHPQMTDIVKKKHHTCYFYWEPFKNHY